MAAQEPVGGHELWSVWSWLWISSLGTSWAPQEPADLLTILASSFLPSLEEEKVSHLGHVPVSWAGCSLTFTGPRPQRPPPPTPAQLQ